MDKIPGTVSAHNQSSINVNGIFTNIIFTKEPPQSSNKWEVSFNIII